MRLNKLRTAKGNSLKVSRAVPRHTMRMYKHSIHRYYHTTYMDKNVVNMFSTFRSRKATCFRRNITVHRQLVPISSIIKLYNTTMGAVDSFDQLLQYYFPHIRSKKYPVKIYLHFMYAAVVNSHILYKKTQSITKGADEFPLLGFITTLIKQLAYRETEEEDQELYDNSFQFPRLQSALDTRNLHSTEHFPRFRPSRSNEQTVDHRRQCRECGQRKTLSYCTKCKVFLCIGSDDTPDCFMKFHKDH